MKAASRKLRRSRTLCRLAGPRSPGFCRIASSSLASAIWQSARASVTPSEASRATVEIIATRLMVLHQIWQSAVWESAALPSALERQRPCRSGNYSMISMILCVRGSTSNRALLNRILAEAGPLLATNVGSVR